MSDKKKEDVAISILKQNYDAAVNAGRSMAKQLFEKERECDKLKEEIEMLKRTFVTCDPYVQSVKIHHVSGRADLGFSGCFQTS